MCCGNARAIGEALYWEEMREVVEALADIEVDAPYQQSVERARALRDKLWPPTVDDYCDHCQTFVGSKPSPETLALVRAVDAHLGAHRPGDLGRALDAWERRHGTD